MTPVTQMNPGAPAVTQTGDNNAMQTRTDLRNVAIIAHVDHGKTTLVDAMLARPASSARRGESATASWTPGTWSGKRASPSSPRTRRQYQRTASTTINIIDTPGHADFGGEVERGLAMVDGVLLLVDAVRGPAAPDPLRAAQGARTAKLPIVLVINKVDRPDARIKEVVDEAYELFLDLDADENQIEFPIVYACARDGIASLTQPKDGTVPEDSTDLEVLFSTILNTIPAPTFDEDAPLQAHVVNLDASPFLGRLALCRVHEGTSARGRPSPGARPTARSPTSASPSC